MLAGSGHVATVSFVSDLTHVTAPMQRLQLCGEQFSLRRARLHVQSLHIVT